MNLIKGIKRHKFSLGNDIMILYGEVNFKYLQNNNVYCY